MILRTLALTTAILATGCASGPADSPPPATSKQGAPDFHAIGQEPGWLLDIHHGGQIVFEYAYGQKRLVVPTPERRKSSKSGDIFYHADSSGQELLVTISPTPCTDVMSGKRFNYTVNVRLDDKRFEGCGSSSPEPAKVERDD